MKKFVFLVHVAFSAMCPDKCVCPNFPKDEIAFCLQSTGFPDISRSPDLKDLFIGNNLERLPPLADQLPQLRLLQLEDNQITSLSGASIPLSLNELTLDGNLLEKIDVGSILADHPNLKRIYISRNRLTTLTGEFENLPQLIELKLSDNSLTKIPDLRKVPSLVLLHLANNLITSLNGSILRLPNLTHLDLSGNSIKTVTRLRLPALMELNLARNSLQAVDDTLLNSRELGYLQLAQNPLEKVPANLFQKLSKLKNLDLSYTKLMEIPKIPDEMIVNELRLTGVSLNCDCDILWLTEYARELSHVTLGLTELTCGTPSRFSGIPVVDFNPLECKSADSDSSSEEDPCRSWECNYGAECIIENEKPKCVCYDAWGGEHCEQLLIDTAKVTDLPVKSDEPTIWVDDVGAVFVEVSFARLSSTLATLRLWITAEDEFVPVTSDVIDADITEFRYENLQPSREYKLCISTNGPNSCAIFNTLPSNDFLAIETTLTEETNTAETSSEPSSTKELIGAAIAAAVLVVVVICVGVFMKRRKYSEKHQKSSYSGASGEECSTWRYAGAAGNCPSTDRSTSNMTPESVPYSSYTGNGSENNYAEVCTNYHLARTPKFAFEPVALAQSTPQRTEPRNSRCEPPFYHYNPDELSKTFHGNQHHSQPRPLYTHHNNTNGYYCA
ncbi:unnamed protein product [Oikopleura dioica]|uniref:EGF-like domain-containing protein n=1 Tax=Oikopleura dioica TaxID=34765 RepID=E4XPP4_OIKDI|nr:unnamed protein product [Oikopleura dioica]